MRRIVGLGLLLGTLSPLGLAGQSSDPDAESGDPAGLTEWLPSKLLPGSPTCLCWVRGPGQAPTSTVSGLRMAS